MPQWTKEDILATFKEDNAVPERDFTGSRFGDGRSLHIAINSFAMATGGMMMDKTASLRRLKEIGLWTWTSHQFLYSSNDNIRLTY
ncbi:hypothetical protein O9929_16755 [Vibrio lentus]|nr:hypothetical protein [Vibrio lentus]